MVIASRLGARRNLPTRSVTVGPNGADHHLKIADILHRSWSRKIPTPVGVHVHRILMLAKILLGSAMLLAADRGLNAQSALDPGTLYKQSSPAVVIIETTGSDGKVAKTGS